MNIRKMTTVFMTGATGHMGREALKLLAEDRRIRLKLLIQGTKKDRRILKPFRLYENIEIIKGDLRNIEDVSKGVSGADFVLHLGAMIPPAADRYPEAAEQINYGGTLNIIRAIKEQDDPDSVRLVYIATVASMGNRPAPIHWGRAGDPIMVSRFDAYAVSKVRAERAVIESGLKYWVSLRQSGMLHRDMLRIMDPIIFHQPLDNHIEWSTAEDSGTALYRLCTEELPDEFWRNMYNIGSGPEFRDTYFDFCKTLFGRVGITDIQRIFKPRDFATRNFHCVWYADSERLEKWLHFRRSTYQGFLKTLDIPFYYRLVKLLPLGLVRKLIFEPLSRRTEGTRHWIEHNITDKIRAFWGSRERWESIPEKWEELKIEKVPNAVKVIHGWDDEKDVSEIDLEDCTKAAAFRGGLCLSPEMRKGDIYKPLQWRCSCGRRFRASPNLVLRGGHWCPDCDTEPDYYEQQAARSMFFGQVYQPV